MYLNSTDQLIPVKDLVLEDDTDVNTVINVALLLPYYSAYNEAISYEDTLELSTKFYKKSEAALSFHVGLN